VTVTGLCTTTPPVDDPGATPVVCGVRLGSTDARTSVPAELAADVVVASLGRRSAAPRWLADIGVSVDVTEEDTGIVYLSRFYRLHDGVEPPPADGPIGGDLGYLKYAVFQGDNRTFSVTFAVRTQDGELRAALLDETRFDAAAQLLPATTAWADPALATPITPVHVMGGLLNRVVRFRHADGRPKLLGFHAVGDAHTCTNPLYGRGCSLAMVQATLLADALVAHPGDAQAAARTYEDACAREIEPWYRAAVGQDRMNREAARDESLEERGFDEAKLDALAAAAAEAEAQAEAADAQAATALLIPREMLRDLLRDGVLPAVRLDAKVFRAFIRIFNLLEPPDALLADGDLVGRVLGVFQDRDNRPPEPPLGPPRREMLAHLEPATTPSA
jgi:flavin-dependent dehydrogenase